jgi:iron complex outermembrane receptor protein
MLGAPVQAADNAEETTKAKTKAYTLDSVTVTAEKTPQDPQTIPASITTLGQDAIADNDIDDTSRIFETVPNMYMVKFGPSAAFGAPASMRGITSSMTGNPAIGFYVDDVYYPNFDIDLYDLERIEVLRGPQGTLYGRNTEAGVINVVTKKPGQQWEGKVTGTVANYNTQKVSFATGGPLVADKLAFRVSGNAFRTDGFFKNAYDDDRAVDKQDNLDGRATAHWTPSDAFNMTLSADMQHYRGNYAEFARLDTLTDKPHEVDVDYPGKADKDAVGGSLRAEYDAGPVKVTSITAARNEYNLTDQDLDFTPYDLMRLKLIKDVSLLSEEVRLASNTPDSPLRWLAGTYLFYEYDDQRYTTQLMPGSGMAGFLKQEGKTGAFGAAVFGQATYTLLDQLDITAGLRFDNENKTYDYSWTGGAYGISDASGSSGKNFDAWLPKFAVDWRATENLMPYVSVSRGFKSGGFNLKANPGQAYDSEFTWNYEAGVKSQWFDKKVLFNIAGFYIDWTNLQVEQPDYPDFTIVNAASATSRGLEAELRLRPLTGLELRGNLGYTEATFNSFMYNGVSYAGHRVPSVPSVTYLIGGAYRFLDGFFANAELVGTGEIQWDAANSRHQAPYQLVNAKAGYEGSHYEVYLWGKNIFNQVYATRAFTMSDTWYGRAGDPATVGVNLSFFF